MDLATNLLVYYRMGGCEICSRSSIHFQFGGSQLQKITVWFLMLGYIIGVYWSIDKGSVRSSIGVSRPCFWCCWNGDFQRTICETCGFWCKYWNFVLPHFILNAPPDLQRQLFSKGWNHISGALKGVFDIEGMGLCLEKNTWMEGTLKGFILVLTANHTGFLAFSFFLLSPCPSWTGCTATGASACLHRAQCHPEAAVPICADGGCVEQRRSAETKRTLWLPMTTFTLAFACLGRPHSCWASFHCSRLHALPLDYVAYPWSSRDAATCSPRQRRELPTKRRNRRLFLASKHRCGQWHPRCILPPRQCSYFGPLSAISGPPRSCSGRYLLASNTQPALCKFDPGLSRLKCFARARHSFLGRSCGSRPTSTIRSRQWPCRCFGRCSRLCLVRGRAWHWRGIHPSFAAAFCDLHGVEKKHRQVGLYGMWNLYVRDVLYVL